MHIRWHPEAVQDVIDACAYIDLDRPVVADQLAQTITDAVTQIGNMPNIGHPGRRRGTRELVLGGWPYIIAYTIQKECVLVLAIVHTAKRWPRLSARKI